MLTSLQSLPPTLRPREKVLSNPSQANLPELLSALIGSGCGGRPLNTIVGCVVELLRKAKPGEIPNFTQVGGVGSAAAARLVAALQLAESVQKLRTPRELSNPQLIFEACKTIRYREQEHVAVLYLNTRLSLICQEVVTIGTVSASLIHPREVFRPAILHNASHIALAHNHPSGCPTPSEADLAVTKQISRVGKEIGIQLIDHLICTGSSYTSLKMEAPELFC